MMEPDLLCADQKDKIMSAQPCVALPKPFSAAHLHFPLVLLGYY